MRDALTRSDPIISRVHRDNIPHATHSDERGQGSLRQKTLFVRAGCPAVASIHAPAKLTTTIVCAMRSTPSERRAVTAERIAGVVAAGTKLPQAAIRRGDAMGVR
jgi:hypothetical protein